MLLLLLSLGLLLLLLLLLLHGVQQNVGLTFLPERDYVTFGSLLSQFSLSVVCRPSVCRLSVCRLSVTLVHLTQDVETFRNISSPLCTLAIV